MTSKKNAFIVETALSFQELRRIKMETQILLSGDLGYIVIDKLKKLLEGIGEVERMFKALIKSLEKSTRILEPLNPRILCFNIIYKEEAK
ncbi:MAG: hypothetical protein MUP98_17810 [Candidatus Aminicenantes bacterium]|nr:hypothetical protein [Candidatus Aminicenantes bacterium]